MVNKYMKMCSTSLTTEMWIKINMRYYLIPIRLSIIKKMRHNKCWRRHWHPTPVLLPGKSHGRRSLEGCSPWGRWVSDTTERLHFHFSLSCIGEGNGNPPQCSCLESPRDGVAWWAAIYGVAQSQTRLKQLSSSSNNLSKILQMTMNSLQYNFSHNCRSSQAFFWY